MPVYTYFCEDNQLAVEVTHSIRETLATWGEVCARADLPRGETPAKAPVKRLLSAPNINVPTGDSKIKEKGFTKLVRRDQGVYENVTATGTESRYFKADDPSSMPHLHKKIGS
jgi:predicted nucleic acid-binding Zn ribbon protein